MVLHSGRLHCICCPCSMCHSIYPGRPDQDGDRHDHRTRNPQKTRSCCTVRCTASARIFEVWQNNNLAPSTKSGKPVCCSVSGLLCFFNPTFTRANASHAITFLSMQPHKTKQETRQGICIFPVQSLYDLSCFCISTFAQIFILLSALLQPSQQLLLYLLLLQSLLRSPPVHLKPCVPLRYLQLLRVPSD